MLSATFTDNVVTLGLSRAIVSGDSHDLQVGESGVRDMDDRRATATNTSATPPSSTTCRNRRGRSPASSIDFTSVPSRGENDDTYRIDDTIKATVTFSAAVTVTGVPQFVLNVGGGPRRADYESGSGSTDLVFSYTVVEGDEAPDGVAVEKDEIALNGGTIQAGMTDAALSHGAEAANPAHKVDGIRPIFVSADTTVDGMQILVTFSEHLREASPFFQVFDGSADADRPRVERTPFTENVVTLELDRAIVSGVSLTLTIGEAAVHDLASNANPVSLSNPITNNVPPDGTAIDIDAKDSVEVLEGHQARLEVRLHAMPSATVTVGVVSSNTAKVTVSPASLDFLTTDWDDYLNLTITPVDDSDSSDETVTLTLSGTGLTTKTVTVDVADDEMSLTLPQSPVPVNEGGTATIDVTLASAPSARFPRTVDVSSGNTAAVTVAPSSLTFTSTNWDEAQTVTVTGEQDGNTTGERVTISFRARDVQEGTVTVTVTDDDDGGGGGGGGGGRRRTIRRRPSLPSRPACRAT